jgi:hypothetical protein
MLLKSHAVFNSTYFVREFILRIKHSQSGLRLQQEMRIEPMEALPEFLTVEESHQVDAALLTSRSKFTVRVSLYALRSLKAIAQSRGSSIAALDHSAIAQWIAQDPSLQGQLDDQFRGFFTQLVTASLKPLQQIAAQRPIEQIDTQQVIAWFEQQDRLQ